MQRSKTGELRKSGNKKLPVAATPKLGLVFGRRLEEVIETQNNGISVPKIVVDTVTWLEANGGFNEEGLFRVPGQMTIVEALKKEYDLQGTGNMSEITDVASVAGLLKLYLRELPEPLLVYRFYSTFVKIAKNPEPESRLRNLRILVNGLPEANKATVFYLLNFLAKVTVNEKVNRMSAANLAMIFSPNLLRTEKEELSQVMMEAGYLTSVIKLMIEEIDFLTGTSDQPATMKGSSTGEFTANKPELDQDKGVDVSLDEMKRRMSLRGSGSEIKAFLEAENRKDVSNNNNEKLVDDQADSATVAESEMKKKELEDIKQQVKERELHLQRLQEQLEADSDDEDEQVSPKQKEEEEANDDDDDEEEKASSDNDDDDDVKHGSDQEESSHSSSSDS